jgi:hypothetical protein
MNKSCGKSEIKLIYQLITETSRVLYKEKTFLPKWLEITSSSIFPAIWAGFLSSKSRNNGFPAISVGKSCSYSRKN